MQSINEKLNRIPRAALRRIRGTIIQRRISRMHQIAGKKPLILQVETINICNAACVFCGYTSMSRKKGVMSMATFTKAIKEYAQMGGGALSLTPIVGDALLDPHLLERFKVLDGYPTVNQITLTTNGICMDQYTDEDISYLQCGQEPHPRNPRDSFR